VSRVLDTPLPLAHTATYGRTRCPERTPTVTDEHPPTGPHLWCSGGCGRDLYETHSWREPTCEACLKAEQDKRDEQVRGWEQADRG